MKYTSVPVTPYQQNCSIIVCEKTNKAAIVDPGGDIALILQTKDMLGADVEKILITHAHIDHAGATAELASQLGVPIEGPHPDDQFLIDMIEKQGAQLGIENARPFTPDRWLGDGDQVQVGDTTLDVVHCPGHTPGHVIFHEPQSQLALVGDVLFNGSIGRTDFPRGNHADLISSIRDKLWPLGDDVKFISGHGPMSTFGVERQHNPFVADALFDE